MNYRFKRIFVLILATAAINAWAESDNAKNFEGFGISIDYSVNRIDDISYPGGESHARSGIPSVTLDYWKSFTDSVLGGVYVIQDLATTDTTGQDPDAQYPIEGGIKLGYAFTDDLLGYIRGGYTWSRLSGGPGYNHWMNGPSYGFGAEYKFTDHIFTRLDFNQQNYERIAWSDGSADKIYILSYGISLGWRF